MRRSLLVRLLGLSLAVAVVSIAATAWLTTRDTGKRLRAEFASTLEADSFVHSQLLAYAQRNDSWENVQPVLGKLSDAIGRRIALTTLEGAPIADSSSANTAELPSDPVAEINATKTGLSLGDGMMAWRLTDAERERRGKLRTQANACFKEKYPDVRIEVSDEGHVVAGADVTPIEKDEDPSEVPSDAHSAETPDSAAVSECVPAQLYEPSAAARKVTNRINQLTRACFERHGLPTDALPISDGHPLDGPAYLEDEFGSESPASSGTVVDGDKHGNDTLDAAMDCVIEARSEALGPYLPDPALLYIGSSERFDPFSRGGWQRTAVTGLIVLTLAAGLTVLAGQRLTRPIRDLTLAARKMAAGNRATRVPVNGAGEVARLGQAFNGMADSIAASERQRKAMVTDVAHELRTPLANVRGYLEAAEDGVVPLNDELVASLMEESEHLHHLIDDLGVLAVADAGELRMYPEQIDAADLAAKVVATHQATAVRDGVTLSAELERPIPLTVDPVRLRQALSNLVVNAVRYTRQGGQVTVRAHSHENDVLFEVADTGPGIAADHLPHLFDRFYRVEKSRSRTTGGSGLGLAITRQLVEANGGDVTVDSAEGKGSTFTVRFPRQAQPSIL